MKDESEQEQVFNTSTFNHVHWLVLGKVFLFILYFTVSVILVREMGKELYGKYEIYKSIIEVLIIPCSLGLAASAGRFIPEMTAYKDKPALKAFIISSLLLQLCALVITYFVLSMASDYLHETLELAIDDVILLVLILTGALLFKQFIASVFISLFLVRTLTALSIMQAVLMFVLLICWSQFQLTPRMALVIEAFSCGLVYFLGCHLLIRRVYSFDWPETSTKTITVSRVFIFALTSFINRILGMLMFKYSEVFFLGMAFGAADVGVYVLGYTLPYMALTFIPYALIGVLTAAFAESYLRNKEHLPKLISSTYKILIIMTVPLAVFFVIYIDRIIVLVYGEEMKDAGFVAACFSAIHLISMISIPLSMAMKAAEKVQFTIPVLIVQAIVNLTLDYVLIVYFKLGIKGAVVAVLLTFIVTTPLNLHIVKKLIGGIWFPFKFFIKVLCLCLIIAIAMMPAHSYLNLWTFPIISCCYGIVILYSLHFFKIISEEDIADFRELNLSRLNKILDFVSHNKRGK